MKRLLALLVPEVTLSLSTYAFAPMMDSFLEYRHRLFYVYLYCIILGLISLLIFWKVYTAKKDIFSPRLERFTRFLRESPSWAIIICGVLLSVPLGLFMNISYYFIFFIFTIPIFLILIILFSILLAINKVRNKFLLRSKTFLKWNILLAISAICASALYLAITECNLLYEPSIFCYSRGVVYPSDLIIKIWSDVLPFLCATLVSLIFFWIGTGIHFAVKQTVNIVRNIPKYKRRY